jgi:RNA polymerase sigma-70 factor (ECF subfamily)
VLRECLRWRRRRWLQILGLTDRVVAAVTPDPVAHVDLARAVRRLSPKLRAVIFLHFYEDKTLSQIATDLNIPESTAKTRLYEALRRLERALPAYAPPSDAGEQT